MHRARFARCAWFARSFAIASLAFMSFTTQATATVPKPFVATYAVTFRGLNAGTLRMEFRHDSNPQRYVLETRANPSALASFVISSAAFERTILEVTPDGLRPVQWELDDGKSGNKGDGQLSFNWSDLTVSGSYEGQPVKLALEPGMQDRLSIQLGAMTSLLQGHEPGTIAMVNGDNIRHYTYKRGRAETVQSKLGALDTVVYESTRPNSNRISRVWHAPSLEFIAARAEQIRKGKVETVMTLIALESR